MRRRPSPARSSCRFSTAEASDRVSGTRECLRSADFLRKYPGGLSLASPPPFSCRHAPASGVIPAFCVSKPGTLRRILTYFAIEKRKSTCYNISAVLAPRPDGTALPAVPGCPPRRAQRAWGKLQESSEIKGDADRDEIRNRRSDTRSYISIPPHKRRQSLI